VSLTDLVLSWPRILERSFRRWQVVGRTYVLRYLPNESQHLFALTLTVGVVCGVVAVAFHLAIKLAETLLIDRAMHAGGHSWMVWTIVSPTLGGLLAGAALTWLVPGARGSGVPQVKHAFATEGGRIRARDALGKFAISSLQIGSGASLGREGPTVQICAGVASLLARATSLPPRNMRRLTPVGVAAGIAAAFNAPIAAVTFTIEEIVGTLDHAILSGVVVAAALAAVIERGILGVHPVIQVEHAYGLDHAASLPFYALLGLAAALLSVGFTDSLLRLRLWFRGVRAMPAWTQPAVGGLVTGVLAVIVIQFFASSGVTGGGYETLGRALAGELSLRALLALCLAKLVATVFSYSSGGAGGVFAPALFMGGMLGGVIGHLDVLMLGHESRQIGAFALVGMGAVFAGVVRAPITSVLIIFEMTGGYGLVLPLMLANMTSFILARKLRPTPIYEALLQQDGLTLPRPAPKAHPAELMSISEAMTSPVVSVTNEHSIADVLALVATKNFALVPVVGDEQALLGAISVSELRQAKDHESVATLTRTAHRVRADEPLVRAVIRMNDLGTRQLLVLDAASGTRLVGVLSMSDVVRTYASAASGGNSSAETKDRHSMLELRVETLMLASILVPGSLAVTELAKRMHSSGAKVAVVRLHANEYRVLLPEQINEFARDEELEKMLVAEDLARVAPTIAHDADIRTLLAVLQDRETETAIVLGAEHEPVGVVTKNVLARAFYEKYGLRAGFAEDLRRSS
jgi:chloride channel protein, CIC family